MIEPHELRIVTDALGFHHPHVDLSIADERHAVLQAALDEGKQLEHIHHVLLIIFSNQEKIYEGIQSMTTSNNAETAALAELTAAVQSNNAVVQSAVNTFGTLESLVAQLRDELAAGPITSVDNSPALSALAATLEGGTQALTDAINASGALGTVTAPPVTAPVPADPTAGTGDAGSSAPTDGTVDPGQGDASAPQ